MQQKGNYNYPYLLTGHGNKTVFNARLEHRSWTIPESVHLQISKVPFNKFYIYIRTQSHMLLHTDLEMYCNAVWYHKAK